ncbi:MAG: FkbM family methyltransferase [Burkholderiales bacterium]|nr:FkbM family methyltransferase [Burkholderiales bacterium]
MIGWRSRRACERAEDAEWSARTAVALACPDNARIPRHPRAGSVSGGYLTMFNGARVLVDGYYGAHMTRLLRANLGSHEPQEELVFAEVLRQLRPGACMLECGAYWGFYSIWFLLQAEGGEAWLVEPEREHLEIGRANLRANNVSARTCRALVGRQSAPGAPETVSVDDFMRRERIARLDILHADIQGAELDMLAGAESALQAKAIDFLFISTHGDDLHEDCARSLGAHAYEMQVSIPPAQSFSVDGLIVACRPGALRGALPVPSLRPGGDPGRRS